MFIMIVKRLIVQHKELLKANTKNLQLHNVVEEAKCQAEGIKNVIRPRVKKVVTWTVVTVRIRAEIMHTALTIEDKVTLHVNVMVVAVSIQRLPTK